MKAPSVSTTGGSGSIFEERIAGLAAWKDGVVQDAATAGISVWDHGFLYGDGVFEGLRLRSRRLFRVHDHLARLRRSARMLQLDVLYEDDEFIEAMRLLAAKNALDDAHVRILLTRGMGMPSLDPRHCAAPTTVILMYPFPATLGDAPVSLIISSVARKAPRSLDPAAKSLNYHDAILAKLQAIAANADDALLLDGEGFVAEATGTNVFLVVNGALVTPESTAALPGVTRRTVMELARREGVEVVERRVTSGELYAAEEVFLTGSGAGIVSVGCIDGRRLNDAPGSLTRKVQDWYQSSWTSTELSVSI